jgi:uncharacterized protein YidB (DUF937 family)
MGLLDNLVSQFAGGAQGQAINPVLTTIGSLLGGAQSGGLAALVAQFTQAGFGQHIQSWISTGQNLPISADQITQVLGSSRVQELARAAGIDPTQMSAHLSELLPQLIDHLTPSGQLPQGGAQDVLSALSGFLKAKSSN